MTGTVCSWLKLRRLMAGNSDRDIVAAYSYRIHTYIHTCILVHAQAIEVQVFKRTCVCPLE